MGYIAFNLEQPKEEHMKVIIAAARTGGYQKQDGSQSARDAS